MKSAVLVLFFSLSFPASASVSDPDGKYISELTANMQSPETYVTGKFSEYDVVLLGEDHAIVETLSFVARLIPQLYKAGVRNIVMEFGAEEDQKALDRLITAQTYDEAEAKRIMFNYHSNWAWVEYRDIYKAAWTFNRSLPKGETPFRIVNMSYKYRNYEGPQGVVRTAETLRRIFWRGSLEKFRFEVIENEIFRRGEKALVLAGYTHMFTRYVMANANGNSDSFCQFDGDTLGNRLFRTHPGQVVSVLTHQPFAKLEGANQTLIQPAQGAIERIMAKMGNKPQGFDLRNHVMGTLPDKTKYSMCYDDFRISDFADGYVFFAPIRDLHVAKVDLDFVNASNIDQALKYYHPSRPRTPTNVAEFRELIAEMPKEVKSRYGSVKTE